MHTVELTDEVWDEIAKRGKFGETEDDVLRRVFGIGPVSMSHQPQRAPVTMKRRSPQQLRSNYATNRQTARIEGDHLFVSYQSGESQRFPLPNRNDREGIRLLTNNALLFARDMNATIGQQNAVRKALTDAGYHINK